MEPPIAMQMEKDASNHCSGWYMSGPLGSAMMMRCTATAPNLPDAAAIPKKVHRYLVGAISAGI